jgi:glucose-6-phosphate 1-dehydrogenase
MPSTTTLAPTALVIFGITGDLAQRKLLPALRHLMEDRLLPEDFHIIGVSRREVSKNSVLQSVRSTCQESCDLAGLTALDQLEQSLTMFQLDMEELEGYQKLKTKLDDLERAAGHCLQRLYYLAIPPAAFGQAVELLGKAGLNAGCSHGKGESRLLVEKPFGYDLASAKELLQDTTRYFNEEQIFRIDHYLAKETVQNILAFRFENFLIEGVWHRNFIDHIQITASETLGIEGRISFYEQTGALRDIIQSHLLQLTAITLMERPEDMSAQSIHKAKLDLLSSIQRIQPDQVESVTARGQYAGYLEDIGKHQSSTETFAALKLEVNNDRWQGVPILLRAGKGLEEKVTEITVVFKSNSPHPAGQPNNLTIRIQPNEGIALDLLAKKPGFDNALQAVQMAFCYRNLMSDLHPDAYERVIIDAMKGDLTLFPSGSEILATWELLEPVLQQWGNSDQPPEVYPIGSWGPTSADRLAASIGATWLSQHIQVCSVHTI